MLYRNPTESSIHFNPMSIRGVYTSSNPATFKPTFFRFVLHDIIRLFESVMDILFKERVNEIMILLTTSALMLNNNRENVCY